jgi:hypothetical protein
MNRTRSVWLTTALLCGALLAGCGSSNSTTTSTASSTPSATTQSAPATTPSTTSSTPSTTTPTPTTTAPTSSIPPASVARLAGAICKSKTAAARAQLPATLKAQVEAICHDYATGNTSKAREDAKKACIEAVKAIPGESQAKKQALARCEGK